MLSFGTLCDRDSNVQRAEGQQEDEGAVFSRCRMFSFLGWLTRRSETGGLRGHIESQVGHRAS